MAAVKMKRVATFWGSIVVPSRIGVKQATTLAYIAWKGGMYEDKFKPSFARWFRKFAEKHPELAEVKVFDVYPVDEFRFLGKYDTNSSESEPEPGEDPVRDALV